MTIQSPIDFKEKLLGEVAYIRSKIDDTKPNIFGALAKRLEDMANEIDTAYFPVSYVSREDLRRYGVDIDKVADYQMETLADELGGYFTEAGGYWDFLSGYSDKLPKTPWGKEGWMQLSLEEAKNYFEENDSIWVWEVNQKTGRGDIAHIKSDCSFKALCKKEKTVFIILGDS